VGLSISGVVKGVFGVVDVGDLAGVEGVPGRGDDAVVDEVVLRVDIEVLAEGFQGVPPP
jgi:hypothetical protein